MVNMDVINLLGVSETVYYFQSSPVQSNSDSSNPSQP